MMFVFAVILIVCAFKLTAFAVRTSIKLFGVGLVVAAFLLLGLRPLLWLLLKVAVPIIFCIGLYFTVLIIVKAIQKLRS